MDQIKNMNVLITGAASGIGLSYAQHMLKNGAKTVAILDLPTSPGATSAANLEKEFGKGKAVFFQCDVTNIQQFEEAFKKAVNTMNGVDIVINNAGLINDKNWELTLRVNVGGVIQGSLLAVEHMRKDKGGKGGVVVNIGSIVSLGIYPTFPVYCSSKHDVLAFSRCLERAYPSTGVRVLVMCPGVTNTCLFDTMEQTKFEFIESGDLRQLIDTLPQQEPENVAEAMVLLIQKGKNGSVWVSEGGQPPFGAEFVPYKKVELNL